MLRLYVRFESRRPQWALIIDGDAVTHLPLFQPNTGITLDKIFENVELIADIYKSKATIVTHNFKDQLAAFDLPLSKSRYKVYDVCDFSLDKANADDVPELMARKDAMPWQALLANAAVVYQYLENRGVKLDYHRVKPIWDLSTFTGRSRTTGYNLQGATKEDNLSSVTDMVDPCFLNFDWVSADMRAASLLSNDKLLSQIFSLSDPYTAVAELLGDYDRDNAKLQLLKSINSLNVESPALQPFQGLVNWMGDCRERLANDGYLYSLLGRKFEIDLESNRTHLSVFNATMQGTVAHAMHSVIRSVWEVLDHYVFADSHDSLSLVVPKSHVEQTIEIVTGIMVSPFKDINNNHTFSVRAYLGKKWKRWKRFDRIF